MAKFVENFRRDIEQDYTDGRLNAPAAVRNRDVIADVLHDILIFDSGHILEIGSGTGQHIIHFASVFPKLTWWPSDPDPDHIVSIEGWRSHHQAPNVKPAIQMDASKEWDISSQFEQADGILTAVFSANVIHIASWEVAVGILSGAGKYLQEEGLLILYGPYSREGDFLSEGNINFNNSLKLRNPEWGVRDVDDVTEEAQKYNLKLDKIIDMPSSNSTVILRKKS